MNCAPCRGGLPADLVRDVFRASLEARPVTASQTESFNHTLDANLPKVINERYQTSTVNTRGDALTTVTYLHVYLSNPVVKEQSGSVRPVSITECIQRRLPFVFRVFATVVVERYTNAAAASGVNLWDTYDPTTGRVWEDTGKNVCSGTMTTDDTLHGGTMAPRLASVSLHSTDNPDDVHHLAAAAAERARQVRWKLAEVHNAGSQCIMELPAQIGCKVCPEAACALQSPNAAWTASGEIVPNGTLRMAVQQRRVQVNRVLVSRLKHAGVQAQVRSVLEHRHRSTSTLTVKMFPDWGSSEKVRAWVELPYVRFHVPLMALFRLLGVKTVRHAAQMVASGGEDAGSAEWAPGEAYCTPEHLSMRRWVEGLLRPAPVFTKRKAGKGSTPPPPARGDTSSDAAAAWTVAGAAYTPAFPDFETYSRKQVGEWMSAKSAVQQYNPDAKWMSTLSTETLPQLGLGTAPETLTAKAMLLAHAVWRAAVVARGGGSADCRDALCNNYYATTGELTTLLLRQCMRKLVKAVSMTMRNNPMQSAQIADCLRKRTVTDNARYAFNTGNWGERKGNATMNQQETTQQRPQGNLMSQRSHLTVLRTPLREKSKNHDVRQLHPSYYGFVCPAAHSEGAPCGLRVQLSSLAHATCGQDSRAMIPCVVRALTRAAGSAFVPAPFEHITSGAVARPQPPITTSVFDVTQQHMVRTARHERKQVFSREQRAYQLQSLAGLGGAQIGAGDALRDGGGAADAQEDTAVVASMKWPGSAAAEAAQDMHGQVWEGVLHSVQVHSALVRARARGTVVAQVSVNGIPVGSVGCAASAATALRGARRAGWLPRDAEVAVLDGGRTVWVGAQSGELRRPLWVFNGAHSAGDAVGLWRSWAASGAPPCDLWHQAMAHGFIEMVGPNEVRNLLIVEDPRREGWGAGVARGATHAEVHPAGMLSASVGCLPLCNHNQGPRNAYYHALANSACSEAPPVLGNDTTHTSLLTPGQRVVRTVVEDAIFPMGYGAGAVALVAVMCAGDNVEDSMIVQRESIMGGMLAALEVHTYTAAAARGSAALRTSDCKVFGVPTASTQGTQISDYGTLEADGLPRAGTRVAPGSAIVGVQRRQLCKPTAHGAVEHPVTGQSVTLHDGSSWTSARDVPCVVSDVRVSPALRVGQSMAVVQTTSLRIPEVGDKIAVSPSQKGTIATLVPASHMPVSPTVGRPHIIMNPHAIPSRMTEGKDQEGLIALAALLDGLVEADGTPWGSAHHTEWARGRLRAHGVSVHGTHTFYDGVTGKVLQMRVFAVPQFVSRLRQMSANKINMRATGPVNQLTGQATEGRAVGGGQRLGAMENDALVSSGATAVLQERFCDAADGVTAWVCRACGCSAIPPAPPHIMGGAVTARGTVSPEDVAWSTQFVADTHARCAVCGSSDSVAWVRTRRSVLLLMRELAVTGIRMRFEVDVDGSADTLDGLSPAAASVMHTLDGVAAPRPVPLNASREDALRLRTAPAAGTALDLGLPPGPLAQPVGVWNDDGGSMFESDSDDEYEYGVFAAASGMV